MKKRVLILVYALSIMFTGITASPGYGASGLPVVRVGIVLDGPWGRNAEWIDSIRNEVRQINEGEFDIQFPPSLLLDGQWTLRGVNQAIDQLLSDHDADIIIALGVVASQEIIKRPPLTKPVIAPFIVDAELQNLPQKDETSGIHNLNYINTLRSVARDIETFRQITPFSVLAILADSVTLEALPELQELILRISRDSQTDIHLVPVRTTVEESLRALPPSTEAVIVSSLLRLSPYQFQEIITGLIARRLPGFSIWSRDDVEKGLLATSTPAGFPEYLARNVAVNVHDILRGQDPADLSTVLKPGEQLTINMETARDIDVYPGLGILTEAELLNEKRKDIGRVLTLEGAITEGIAANLDLAAAERNVFAGAEAVKEARSQLFPQVEIGTGGAIIDDDRARAGAGSAPERSWTGQATLSQLLYADSVWTSYAVEKHFQDSRVDEQRTIELDIAQAAAVAYLNVLRAQSIEEIQKNNLRLTRANLERARVRVNVGIAGPDEVYRWQTQIADNRQIVLRSESDTFNAKNSMNRILNRPLQEPFAAEEADLEGSLLGSTNELFHDLITHPKDFLLFRDFLVMKGLETSPELRRFDAEIAARERIMVSAKRAFWLPDVSLQGNVTELFSEGGEGQRSGSPADINDTDWTVGVFATLPLFTSGQKTATYSRTRHELERIRIDREAARERIEQRILTAVNLTRASYPSIELSRDAAKAARENLTLVSDSYERGIKSIIDLIDAQNQALVSEQRAANTVYDFLIDFMDVLRAVGSYDFLLSETGREEWLQSFMAYAAAEAEQRRK